MPKPADVEPTPDALLASAIRVIRGTWTRIERKELRGPYGRQTLLQTIYEVYCGWDPIQRRQIGRRLAQHLPEALDPNPHLLELLIEAALLMIQPQVVGLWVDTIRLGEACHVRPLKLRGFLYAKGGLVRCALEFRERQAEEERREEEQRQEREDERAEKRRRRRAQKVAERFRGIPAFGLYGRSL